MNGYFPGRYFSTRTRSLFQWGKQVSYWNLPFALVEKYTSREIAIHASNFLL